MSWPRESNQILYFILSKACNDVVSNDREKDPTPDDKDERKKKNNKLSTRQQENVLVVKTNEWIEIFFAPHEKYTHIPRPNDLTKAKMKAEVAKIEKEKLIRRAKEMTSYVNNHLSPHWKNPTTGARSGHQIEDCLLIWQQAAFEQKELEEFVKRQKAALKKLKEQEQEQSLPSSCHQRTRNLCIISSQLIRKMMIVMFFLFHIIYKYIHSY